MSARDRLEPWTPSSVEGRWSGLGPYYAMFPIEFARRVVTRFCPIGGQVLDPFCGRGTAPFVASVSGRRGFGTDVNPVAWLYSSVKLNPCPNPKLLNTKVSELLDLTRRGDRVAQSEFQLWCWHADVLAFLRSARRNLNWRGNRVDRTLMAMILVHLHAKRGEGLSNQMRQSKSMSPDYAVRWWKERRLRPPRIDIEYFFEKKVAWRYARGVPGGGLEAVVRLGDARRILPQMPPLRADLLLTSPPYFGVTNYEYDNWIRLWMLGYPPQPSYRTVSRFANSERYVSLLEGTFDRARTHCKRSATIYVRTDSRPFTLDTTTSVLRACWPQHVLSYRQDRILGKTQTSLFHENWSREGEVDLLLTWPGTSIPRGFMRA